MRFSLFFMMLFFGTFFMSCESNAQSTVKAFDQSYTPTIEVIDFHTTHRCKTCLAIEKAAKNVLETTFAKELQAGIIVFKTVNVDEEANAKLAEKYQASGSALFVHNSTTGNAVDLTDFAFMYVMSNENKFKEGFKAEVQKALNAN